MPVFVREWAWTYPTTFALGGAETRDPVELSGLGGLVGDPQTAQDQSEQPGDQQDDGQLDAEAPVPRGQCLRRKTAKLG